MRKKDDEKEKSIKEAVIKLILKEGFHGTSISKIAKEAGVSPATVYIYYENKEVMLRDIYLEYSEEILEYLLNKVSNINNGQMLIEILIKEYYTYIRENEEIFHFVDQFSNCPALANQCASRNSINKLNYLLDNLKEKRIFRDFQNDNLAAIIFSPVKSIAINNCIEERKQVELIDEITRIIQKALLF
ncbi:MULTISPECIES: TetR/AcrR family transcriptional regulator [Clostridium]|jgi:AcrR family transcriptional regulator|uniref:Transcriptional regulator, TetR family n=1 Tax=Clostridium saccharoperbutylacetonicum N1-4(HMT) TaxID=931276 RepID=M1MBA4_9CLOT|nr:MULTISPECIES: TetR/AcrR family transcriptional regulator [Clostridium]AGF55219.1 transcriptional regulator, TetR family [Clostridium saccharoperbutylacetonicum N1-4(HMT)]AQR94108.1 fatty acid metabolism regulator protein [Clostridium saccharoperbutylacetonicum]NRT64070.1 AcrR family transcriptional regulator [Clostridium saccharoperbutylacetonicum]NSB27437.1 AcrR family transcriptional regulator [Clostridium saccharoperbutylacetonicum]NSB29807.1 AcrR family transcriptional regulator [Clostr